MGARPYQPCNIRVVIPTSTWFLDSTCTLQKAHVQRADLCPKEQPVATDNYELEYAMLEAPDVSPTQLGC